MRKDDLRSDPIREKILNALSLLRKNLVLSATLSVLIVSGLVFTLSMFNQNNQTDYSACFKDSNNLDLENYCDQDVIQEKLKDIRQDLDSNQYLLSFLSDFQSLNDLEKLSSIKKLDFKNIDDSYLKSMLYKVYGDLLVDNEDLDSGIEMYDNALRVFNNKKTFSALLNYKIASVYKIKDQPIESKKYVDLALDCEISNSDLVREINILDSRIAVSLSKSTKL